MVIGLILLSFVTADLRGIVVWCAIINNSQTPLVCIRGTWMRCCCPSCYRTFMVYLQLFSSKIKHAHIQHILPHNLCKLTEYFFCHHVPHPDLFPIMNLWDITGKRVNVSVPCLRNEEELWHLMNTTWSIMTASPDMAVIPTTRSQQCSPVLCVCVCVLLYNYNFQMIVNGILVCVFLKFCLICRISSWCGIFSVT